MHWLVTELSAIHRPALERHFLALDSKDRRLRFGIPLSETAVRLYVSRIDFQRDAAFGVFDDELQLLGAAHVAHADQHAELGVSVLLGYRNRGVGGTLLERATLRARNWGVRALFMHCLRENAAMVHVAHRRRMRIVIEADEADAWLNLPPADAASHFGEVFEQRVALFDYALKSQFASARRLAAAGWSFSHGTGGQ